jgi:hypothetical protein
MIHILARSCSPWLAGTIVLALAMLLAPARIEASCGDYVVAGKSATMAAHPSAPERPSFPQPCHGPNCSRSPNLPISPLAPVLVSISDNLVCGLSRREVVADPRLWFGFSAFHAILPIDRPTDIFHPPRFLSM